MISEKPPTLCRRMACSCQSCIDHFEYARLLKILTGDLVKVAMVSIEYLLSCFCAATHLAQKDDLLLPQLGPPQLAQDWSDTVQV